MMRTALFLLITAMMISFSTGCATLVRGDSQKVEFKTDPVGATVTINDKQYKAPVQVTLKRKNEYKITISAQGYQPITFQLRANWDGASLGNIALPGGSMGFGLDTLNGADRSFSTLAEIKLTKSVDIGTEPQQMYSYQGHVLTKSEYDQAVRDEQDYHAGSGTPP